MSDQSFAAILSVSELTLAVRMRLETAFPLLRVEGEISNFTRAASGHYYFSLKDQQSQVRCVMFRNRSQLLSFKPENGQKVTVRCNVGFYEARGEFQLIAAHMAESGDGVLLKRIEALEKFLGDEGLFDDTLKKPLAQFPKQIGVVTSPSGAAIHDILSTLKRRFASIPIIVAPTLVQGLQAPQNIANALQRLDESNTCDVIILARGGGSLEDLMAFNEEVVIRAIANCKTPVVSGVGHETDVTLADKAADQRAPTPTAAAELVSPNSDDYARRVAAFKNALRAGLTTRMTQFNQRLDYLDRRLIGPQQRVDAAREKTLELTARLLRSQRFLFAQCQQNVVSSTLRLSHQNPSANIQRYSALNKSHSHRLAAALLHLRDNQQSRLHNLAQQLNALSPLSTLNRGYAIATKTNSSNIIRSTADIALGDAIDVKLSRGTLQCEVKHRTEDES